MKFGKSIGSQQDENLNLHYVDYKLLKKKIKDVVVQLEAHELNKALRANSEFDAELEAEIERVNSCFAVRQRQLLERTGSLSEDLQATSEASASSSSCPHASGPEVAQRPEAFKRLVAILGDVDQLRKYAVWNAVAVVKILKKRRKQTHFGLEDTAAERAAWLSRQTFFSGSDFAELHAAVESLGHMLVLSELMPLDSGAKRPQLQLEQEPQQCPICLDAISDMVELSCNHRFCWKCFVLGPIAFQPGEYRITQCPICRTETTTAPSAVGDGDASGGMGVGMGMGMGMPSSEGLLTRFLHTYFPKEGLGQADLEDPTEPVARQEGEQSEHEMRDVVGMLVKALLADSTLQRPAKGGSGSEGEHEEPGRGESSGSAVPSDFFQTLPKKAQPEGQTLGAAQKLQWLHMASTGDSFALDGTMYCSLCSEPLLMEVVVTTPCKHHFHRVCINRLEEPKCPLCNFELPFDWFIPKDHPCAEKGFRVVKMKDYRPLFPGGPSRGSYGYPLHAPPPVSLCGPGGLRMKSYLHRIVPMGGSEEDPETPRSLTACPPSSPGDLRQTPGSRLSEDRAENSSGSESSSEDSASEDGDRVHGGSPSKRGRRQAWAYSSIGRIRMLEGGEGADAAEEQAPDLAPPAPPPAAARPHAASAGSAASASASSTDVAGSAARGATSTESEPRNSTVLLLGRHL